MIGLVLSVWLFTVHGIPWLARYAAFATPPHLLRGISERSLAFLDRALFEPSTLSSERKARLRQQFTQLTDEIGTQAPYRLVLRRSPKIGANALALPSGLIILTDELVDLASDEREILGVMAHEVAHVEQRHGLRNIYQSAGIFLLLAILAGDVTSINSTAASLPTLLIEMGYSRHFEREADAHAAAYMLAQGWGTTPLQNMLRRLSGDNASLFPSFLTTHPGTPERLEHLETLQREWSERR
jgi:Zn-dependent protease with chaperone function